ncbi:hypothetical protein WR25_05828 [Diploscapter pachys]|uniref:Uncharacterized protein n=1 Tax=Diploscapter pachys TaxID=2018661 RepID=A0A2A2K0L7_9BILA|nr:hypothetical protein WR25_05828 [Diploscapter pachys]
MAANMVAITKAESNALVTSSRGEEDVPGPAGICPPYGNGFAKRRIDPTYTGGWIVELTNAAPAREPVPCWRSCATWHTPLHRWNDASDPAE